LVLLLDAVQSGPLVTGTGSLVHWGKHRRVVASTGLWRIALVTPSAWSLPTANSIIIIHYHNYHTLPTQSTMQTMQQLHLTSAICDANYTIATSNYWT